MNTGGRWSLIRSVPMGSAWRILTHPCARPRCAVSPALEMRPVAHREHLVFVVDLVNACFVDKAMPFMPEAAKKLADADAGVREAAVELLTAMQLSLRSLGTLLDESLSHRDPLVRRGAIEVVRRSGEEGAVWAESLAARPSRLPSP